MNIKPQAAFQTEEDAKELLDTIRKYVRRHYKGLSEYDTEDLVSGTSVEVLKRCSSYKGVLAEEDFKCFVGLQIEFGAMMTYRNHILPLKMMSKSVLDDLKNEDSVDDIAKKHRLGKKHVSSLAGYADRLGDISEVF